MSAVEEIIEKVRSQYAGEITEAAPCGPREVIFTVPPKQIVQFCQFVVDQGWWHLSTISGVDKGEEIALLYHFYGDHELGVTVRTAVPKDHPRIAAITNAVPAATLYEREVNDLFGVVFEGHPKPERLLLPDDWPEGVYPLRLEEIDKKAQEEDDHA